MKFGIDLLKLRFNAKKLLYIPTDRQPLPKKTDTLNSNKVPKALDILPTKVIVQIYTL